MTATLAPIPYAQAKARADVLEAAWDAAATTLRAVPGSGSGPMGLTPDSVRLSAPYRAAWNAEQAAAAAFKGYMKATRFAQVYKREIRADIDARRAAKLAARQAEEEAAK